MDAAPETELVFVDAPPLPPHIMRQLEQSVMEQVPADAARVEVHIGRVEVVQPAAPPPPPSEAASRAARVCGPQAGAELSEPALVLAWPTSLPSRV